MEQKKENGAGTSFTSSSTATATHDGMSVSSGLSNLYIQNASMPTDLLALRTLQAKQQESELKAKEEIKVDLSREVPSDQALEERKQEVNRLMMNELVDIGTVVCNMLLHYERVE